MNKSQLPPEDQRLIDQALTIDELMHNMTPEQMVAWVGGDDAACGVTLLLPDMNEAAEIMRRLLRTEYVHMQTQRAGGKRCGQCGEGAERAQVVWDSEAHEWVLRCECGKNIPVEAMTHG